MTPTKTITYRATNQENGKWYVGSTIQLLQSRIKQHTENKSNDPFHNSLRKYPSKFVWEVLSEVNGEDRSHEQEVLDSFFGSEFCYNVSSSASGICRIIAQKNGSKVMVERWATEEWREKITTLNRARWDEKSVEEKEELVQKTIDRNAEMWKDEEFRSMMSSAIATSNSRRYEDPNYKGGNTRPVEVTVISTGEVLVFRSIADLSRHFPEKNIQTNKVSAVCSGKRKSHQGLRARYLEND